METFNNDYNNDVLANSSSTKNINYKDNICCSSVLVVMMFVWDECGLAVGKIAVSRQLGRQKCG